MTQRCGAWILATYYTPCVRPSSDRNTHRPDCLEQPQSGLSGTPTDRTVWNTNRPDCLEHPQTILSGTPTDWTVWDTHIPDCLEHSVCGCFRQSGTPTDRTVCNTHRSDCLEHPQTGLFGTSGLWVFQTVRNTHRPYCLEHPQTGLFPFDSQLRYSCDGGRRFEDGLTSRVVLCDILAVWNDSDFTCDCT